MLGFACGLVGLFVALLLVGLGLWLLIGWFALVWIGHGIAVGGVC